MRTTFPNERSTPLNVTRSCSRGGGCGGVSAYHAPSRASRMRGTFKTDDISACIAVIFAGGWGDRETRAYREAQQGKDKQQNKANTGTRRESRVHQSLAFYTHILQGGEQRAPPWWDDVR